MYVNDGMCNVNDQCNVCKWAHAYDHDCMKRIIFTVRFNSTDLRWSRISNTSIFYSSFTLIFELQIFTIKIRDRRERSKSVSLDDVLAMITVPLQAAFHDPALVRQVHAIRPQPAYVPRYRRLPLSVPPRRWHQRRTGALVALPVAAPSTPEPAPRVPPSRLTPKPPLQQVTVDAAQELKPRIFPLLACHFSENHLDLLKRDLTKGWELAHSAGWRRPTPPWAARRSCQCGGGRRRWRRA